MKSNLASSALLAALLLLPALASANDTPTRDRAAELLARNGGISVVAAGPHVEVGSFLIQVATRLGRPTAKLADGTWLYQNRSVDGSEARGTLLVRFNQGRVSGLTLVTHARATAIITQKKEPAAIVAAAHL